MSNILSMPPLFEGENVEELKDQVEKIRQYSKMKRNWENAFQKWSDEMGISDKNYDSYGNCGFGSMCDYCGDNSYGRPCVRALNERCREKHISIDYSDRSNETFKRIWREGK